MSAKANNITLNSILEDKTSGSSELLSRLNSYLLKNARNPEIIREDISLVKYKLKDFAVIVNYLKKLNLVLRKNDSEELIRFLKEFSKDEKETFDRIFIRCKGYLKGRNKILTLSNSKTLVEVFTRLQKEKKNLHVTVCESFPSNEGIVLGKKLSKEGIKTKIIHDSAVSLFIENSDAVIIGADMILKNGNVVNKVGSRNAAIICKYYGIPLYVLASREKLTNFQKFTPLKEIKTRNVDSPDILFEEIDKKLITQIITD
jgi:translation initiation factor 2B subunit (eIF-2B alpha/beta/delta family)